MPLATDAGAVRRILEKDRGWGVYALADLWPPYRDYCEWHVSDDALILLYRGFHPPVLLAAGGDIQPLLPEIPREPRLYLAVRPHVLPLLRQAGYEIQAEKRMHRMILHRHHPAPGSAVRLGPSDADALLKLYADGEAAGEVPGFFDISMLENGVYYGIREGASLIASAGTHVLSLEEGVAGLGNVYTRRDRRRLGLSAIVTSAVVAELRRLQVRTIGLNVEGKNLVAIRVYERLGFAFHCDFCEALATMPR